MSVIHMLVMVVFNRMKVKITSFYAMAPLLSIQKEIPGYPKTGKIDIDLCSPLLFISLTFLLCVILLMMSFGA